MPKQPATLLTPALAARPAEACCTSPDGGALNAEQAEQLAPMFKALGEPIRLRLLSMIAAAGPEACVCDLTGAFEVSGPTISYHLKTLRQAGLVACERRGTWVYYWIREVLRDMALLLTGAPTGNWAARDPHGRPGTRTVAAALVPRAVTRGGRRRLP